MFKRDQIDKNSSVLRRILRTKVKQKEFKINEGKSFYDLNYLVSFYDLNYLVLGIYLIN